jgi:hypothetical protein
MPVAKREHGLHAISREASASRAGTARHACRKLAAARLRVYRHSTRAHVSRSSRPFIAIALVATHARAFPSSTSRAQNRLLESLVRGRPSRQRRARIKYSFKSTRRHGNPAYDSISSMETKKTTFELDLPVARRLSELRSELQFDHGLAASNASGVAIVSALIMNADANRLTKILKQER